MTTFLAEHSEQILIALGELLKERPFERDFTARWATASREFDAPVSAIVFAGEIPGTLHGEYLLDGDYLDALPSFNGDRIPNRWQPDPQFFHHALPSRSRFLSRSLMERFTYPSPQALEFYGRFSHCGWMDFPILGRGIRAKISFMLSERSASINPGIALQHQILEPVIDRWRLKMSLLSLRQRIFKIGQAEWADDDHASLPNDLRNFLALADRTGTAVGGKRWEPITWMREKLNFIDAERRSVSIAISPPNRYFTTPASNTVGTGIRVLLAADHTMFCEGLTTTLHRQLKIRVIGWVTTEREMLCKIDRFQPDVLLLDAESLGKNFLPLVHRLSKDFPALNILVLARDLSEEFVNQCVTAGARSLLGKNATSDELIHAIEALHGGRSYFGEEARRKIDIPLGKQSLSPRELQALCSIAEGNSNKEAATTLGVEVGTFKKYLKRAFAKLDAKSRIQAVNEARKRGILRGMVGLSALILKWQPFVQDGADL